MVYCGVGCCSTLCHISFKLLLDSAYPANLRVQERGPIAAASAGQLCFILGCQQVKCGICGKWLGVLCIFSFSYEDGSYMYSFHYTRVV